MSRMKSLFLQALAMSMIAAENNVYMDRSPLHDKTNYGGNMARSSKKEMKEFTVHGKKIMAYSKKDAIIRYKHLMS